MYLSSLEFANLRSFEQASVRFQHPGQTGAEISGASDNVTLLLGDNGSGKTTLLRAAALAILSPILSESGYRPYYLIRRKPGQATVTRTARIKAEVLLHGQDQSPRGDFAAEVSTRILKMF